MPAALLVLIGLGIGVFALRAYAKTGTGEAKIPLSPADERRGTVPTDWIGKKVKNIPADVKTGMRLQLSRVFGFLNPVTGQLMTRNAMAKAHIAIPIPSKGRNWKGWGIYLRRPHKERVADAADRQSSWEGAAAAEDIVVMAPVVVQPDYGLLGVAVPSWASSIVAKAAELQAALLKEQVEQGKKGAQLAPAVVGQEDMEEDEVLEKHI